LSSDITNGSDGPCTISKTTPYSAQSSWYTDCSSGSGGDIQINNFNLRGSIPSAHAFTYSMWIKPTTIAGTQGTLVSWGNTPIISFCPSGTAGDCQSAADTGRILAQIYKDDGSTNILTPPGNTIESTGRITTSQWWKITVVFTSSLVSIYINGALDSSFPLSAADIFAPGYLFFGDIYGYSPSKVYLDDFMVYDSALTASTIFKQYAETASAHGLAIK